LASLDSVETGRLAADLERALAEIHSLSEKEQRRSAEHVAELERVSAERDKAVASSDDLALDLARAAASAQTAHIDLVGAVRGRRRADTRTRTANRQFLGAVAIAVAFVCLMGYQLGAVVGAAKSVLGYVYSEASNRDLTPTTTQLATNPPPTSDRRTQ